MQQIASMGLEATQLKRSRPEIIESNGYKGGNNGVKSRLEEMSTCFAGRVRDRTLAAQAVWYV